RFWFTNPGFDNGYALRLASGSLQETKFHRWESGFRDEGPVLKLTYLVPGATPRLEVRRTGSNIRVQWPIEHTGFTVESSGDLSNWAPVTNSVSTNASVSLVDLPLSQTQQFFRLKGP